MKGGKHPMSRFFRITLQLVPLALLVLFSLQLCAQDTGGQVNVTGCLKQGGEKGGYYVMSQDGKMYELMGKTGELAKHVNHTVSVTGQQVKLSQAQEEKLEPSEKVEASGSSYVDVRVGDVKMVSANCSQ